VPKGSNSARSLSSSTSSTRFLMYRFMPWYLATRSWRISSNLGAMPASQGVALHMRLRPDSPSTSAADMTSCRTQLCSWAACSTPKAELGTCSSMRLAR
jgi:hypothetical protein